jgi:hypothetical protein
MRKSLVFEATACCLVLLAFTENSQVFSGEAFQAICYAGRSANVSGSSGKNEIAVVIMKKTGYSKKTSERIAQKIIDENCPGVW